MGLLSNQKGFSALEVGFFVIVMGLVGGSGYYVVQKNQSDEPKEVATQQTPTEETKPAEQECGIENKEKVGVTKTIGDKAFDFCMPKGWQFMYVDNNDFYYADLDGLTYDESKEPQFVKTGGSDGARPFYMTLDTNKTSSDYQQLKQMQKVSAPTAVNDANVSIEAYYHLTGKDDLIGAGIDVLPRNTEQYRYVVTDLQSNNNLLVIYNREPGDPDVRTLVESLVASVNPTSDSL